MMYFSNQNVNIFYKKIHCSTSTMAHTQHIYINYSEIIIRNKCGETQRNVLLLDENASNHHMK